MQKYILRNLLIRKAQAVIIQNLMPYLAIWTKSMSQLQCRVWRVLCCVSFMRRIVTAECSLMSGTIRMTELLVSPHSYDRRECTAICISFLVWNVDVKCGIKVQICNGSNKV
jgi:hypothetical protein